jgi:diphthine synthase
MTLGLHTLCLLDIAADQERFLCINEALSMLLEVEKKNKLGIATLESLAIGIARAGSDSPLLRAGSIKQVMACDFGGPPQSLILPGELHFMEAEALIAFAKAPVALRSAVR